MNLLSADVSIRPADMTDVLTLAAMNLKLIKDEHSSNPMNLDRLTIRMKQWLSGDFKAFFVCVQGQHVGYGLYRPEIRESGRKEIYLRQFYIESTSRRRGIGRAAIELFIAECNAKDQRVALDVLAANPSGRAFWEAVGFEAVYTRMRR